MSFRIVLILKRVVLKKKCIYSCLCNRALALILVVKWVLQLSPRHIWIADEG